MKLVGITVILFLLFMPAVRGADTEWFSSTPAGLPGTSISERAAATGWSLSIEHLDETEVHTLHLDGLVQSSTAYIRSDGVLIASEERDAAGTAISRTEYAWDAGGNARAVFLEDRTDGAAAGQVETDLDVHADASVRRRAEGSGNAWRFTEYDNAGRERETVVVADGVVVERTVRIREPDGALKEEVLYTLEAETRKTYDNQGRLSDELIVREDAPVLLRSYRWSDSRLVRLEQRGDGPVSVREFSWSGDTVASERLSVDGELVSEILRVSDTERTETLYRDGVAVIRIFWVDNRKIREEYLRDGEVVRVREEGL